MAKGKQKERSTIDLRIVGVDGHQSIEYVPTPMTVDVDGVVDRRGVRYIGTAHRQPDGKYVALANVGGALLPDRGDDHV